jgi:UDP-3-O-[3-hydroxymyristoyl] glucosamine N-acyltransferase
MEFSAGQIAALLQGELQGDSQLKINNVAKIEEGKPGCISFLANPKYEPFIYTTHSSVVLVSKSFEAKQPISATLIRVEDPYTGFTSLLEEYSRLTTPVKLGVEEPAFIGTGSTTGEGIYRGAFSYIGQNCTIGKNVKIYPQVFIGDNVTIVDHTVLHPGVKVLKGCQIGSHCNIAAGSVIGSDGFGFAPQADGTYKNIPQLGNVIIEDHVDIGANTTIDRATMGSTVIRKGVKLDNLIQIAHNVEVGANTVIASQAGVSGSTKIGENCVIGGQVGVVGHIKMANRTSVGAQSGVSKEVKKEGTILFGSPAIEYGNQMKSIIVFKQLPDLLKKVQDLERTLGEKVKNESSNPGKSTPESAIL